MKNQYTEKLMSARTKAEWAVPTIAMANAVRFHCYQMQEDNFTEAEIIEWLNKVTASSLNPKYNFIVDEK